MSSNEVEIISTQCKLTINCETMDYQCLCVMNSLFDLLGSKWIPELITIFGLHKKLRYSEVEEHLLNISPSVLSGRLKKLENNGFLKRIRYKESPPRVEYYLTENGLKLWENFRQLFEDDIDAFNLIND